MRYLKQCLQAPPHSLSPVLTLFFALFFDPFSPLEQAIVIDGHIPFFTVLHIFDCGYIHIFPAIACFLHFVATEDSLKARNS